jgi:hypothetical protein
VKIHISEEGNGMRLAEYLINYQVGRSGLSTFQVGNGKRSTEGLTYCQGAVVKIQIAKWAMRWDHWIS